MNMLDEWIRGETGESGTGGSWLKGRNGRVVLIIVICLGLLALVWPGTHTTTPSSDISVPSGQNGTGNSIKQTMQADVAAILGQIDGAGAVEVSLTLSSEGMRSYATNDRSERREIQENEGAGGARTTTEETSTRDLAVSSGNPLLVEEKVPEILGVLVVADGADDPTVQENLTNATATLLDISPHKVRVLPREGAQ